MACIYNDRIVMYQDLRRSGIVTVDKVTDMENDNALNQLRNRDL